MIFSRKLWDHGSRRWDSDDWLGAGIDRVGRVDLDGADVQRHRRGGHSAPAHSLLDGTPVRVALRVQGHRRLQRVHQNRVEQHSGPKRGLHLLRHVDQVLHLPPQCHRWERPAGTILYKFANIFRTNVTFFVKFRKGLCFKKFKFWNIRQFLTQ